MKVTLSFLFLVTFLFEQETEFDLGKLSFRGVKFITTKEIVIKTFGQGKKVEPNYECGFFSNDQPLGPYYQLVYTNFTYFGGDNDSFYLQFVDFDAQGKVKLKYDDIPLSGRTTKDDFVKIFGEKVRNEFLKDSDHETVLLQTRNEVGGAGLFWFKNDRLEKFEYWTPC